jgi:hypothetical protein
MVRLRLAAHDILAKQATQASSDGSLFLIQRMFFPLSSKLFHSFLLVSKLFRTFANNMEPTIIEGKTFEFESFEESTIKCFVKDMKNKSHP